MKPEAAIDLYADACRHRHLSARTVEASRGYLARFAHWCALSHLADLREATLDTLIEFHRWMRQHKRPDGKLCSIKYQNRHLRIVKQLFKLLAARNLILTDVGQNFPPLSDPQSLPRGIMNKDEVMRLLQQPLMTTPLGFRDRAMLEVLYSTGLRGGELCRLTLYDLDLPARTLRVLQGKGRRDRVVPVGKVAAGYLGEYIKRVRPILLCPELSRRVGKTAAPLVFVSATGKPLWTADLGRIVKLYREQAGLPDTITTHSLRHTCATEMLKGGASIRHVQELLGHADIMTTQIYTHVVQSDLKRAHARTAPSERRQAVDVPTFDAQAPAWNDRKNAPYWAARHRPKRLETDAAEE